MPFETPASKTLEEWSHPALFTHAPVVCTSCVVALGWVRPAIVPPTTTVEPIVGLTGSGARGLLRWRRPRGRWHQHPFSGEQLLMLPEGTQFSLHWRRAAELVIVAPMERKREHFRARMRTPAMTSLRKFTLFHPSVAGMWQGCLQEIQRVGVPREDVVGPLGQLIGLEILEIATRGPSQTNVKTWRLERSALAKVLAFIPEHYADPLQLEDLAKVAGKWTPSYFGQAFKAATGFSPMDYLMAVRVAEAQQRLEKTDETVADIALACGFGTQSHMVERFRLHFGVPPKAFRNQGSRFPGKIEKRRKPVRWEFR